MTSQLVGFENLPNAFIKSVTITNSSTLEDSLEIIVRVHDLPDRSIWSSTEEFFYKLMRVGLVVATDKTESDLLTSGDLSPMSVKHMSKSLLFEPEETEDSAYFEIKFVKNIKVNLASVTIFAFCFISKMDISDSLGVTVRENYLGPIKSEKVFEASRVVALTNVFMRDDGTYWAGPVHDHNGRFMEGAQHKSEPHNNLRKLSITNTKIKDKRETIVTQRPQSASVQSLISKLFVSYSSETDVNCMFMVNMKAMLLKHSKYGAFINKASEEIVDSLLNQMHFRMISIQRQRIKQSPRSLKAKSARNRVSKVFHKKNILNTQDDAQRRVLNKTRLERNGSFDVLPGEIENTSDYKKIADIQEMFLDYGTELRTMQFTDYEMTSKTPGDYQYKIQLQFVDPVDKFLSTTLAIMKVDLSNLTQYLNRFRRNRMVIDLDVSETVSNYLKFYSYIYEINEFSRNNLALKFTSLIDAKSTDSNSVYKFLKIYKNLYADYLTFIDLDDQKRSNKLLSIKSKEPFTSRITIDKTFEEIITPSNNSLTFSYLPENDNKKTAVYTKSVFLEQADRETEDQFVDQPSYSSKRVSDLVAASIADLQSTKTGFFGPKEFVENFKKNKIRNTLEGAKRLNKSLSKKTRKSSYASKIMPPGLLIQTVKPVSQDITGEKYVESDEILGPNHEFVSYDNVNDDYNRPSVKTKTQKKFLDTFSGFKNNRSVATTVDNIENISPMEAQTLPNQLKAVVNGESEATRSNFMSDQNDLLSHPTTKNLYELKNFSVKEVVYIDGFEKDKNGNLLLNKPMHKTLLLKDFEKLQKPTLCFLKDYVNEKFNITGEEEVQSINSVFIISDRDISAPQKERVSTTASIYKTQDMEYQFMSSNTVKQTNVSIDTPVSPPTSSPTVSTTPTRSTGMRTMTRSPSRPSRGY